MAKRDDDDFDADEIAEAAEEADEAYADVDEAEDAETAEEADAFDDEEPEEPYEEEKPRLQPKVTAWTLVLCFLNVVAAVGFVFLLMLNFDKRQSHTLPGALNEALLGGVGTKEDHEGDTAAQAAMPRPKLSSDDLKAALRGRPGTTNVSEPFTPVEDGIHFHIYSGDMAPKLVKELMGDLGDPVSSIEEEMTKLKTRVANDVKAVADQLKTNMQKATDADKRRKIETLLYPVCVNPMDVEKLEKKVKAAQGPALDKMLEDAVERRILADILMPIELFRAADPNATTGKAKASDVKSDSTPLYPNGVLNYASVLESVAELDAEKLRDLLNRRLDAAASATYDGSVHFGQEWQGLKRWTIEKRQNAAFILVSVACARKHLDNKAKLDDQLLYPRGLERAQRLSGLYDFTGACRRYHDATRQLEERVVAAIALDRDGFATQAKDGPARSHSFADKHAALQTQIRAVQLQIRQTEARIKDLQQQRDRATTLLAEREKHKTDVQIRIVQDRAATSKRVVELRELQHQLHRALVELADAAETNAKLYQRLRQLSGAKGAEQ